MSELGDVAPSCGRKPHVLAVASSLVGRATPPSSGAQNISRGVREGAGAIEPIMRQIRDHGSGFCQAIRLGEWERRRLDKDVDSQSRDFATVALVRREAR